MSLIDTILNYWGLNRLEKPIPEDNTNPLPIDTIVKTKPRAALPPGGRSTEPPQTSATLTTLFDDNKVLVEPGYQYEVIPLIRKLALSNQSVSQALQDIVNLANTGHKVFFDTGVKQEQVVEMRRHLDKVIPTWHYGISGADALVNKLFAQAMISGAVVTEIVPSNQLTHIRRLFMPLPETIRFKYNKRTTTYEPYQVSHDPLNRAIPDGLVKLNINTFKYYAINGDTELPYANPPYLPALPPLHDQKEMLDNIKWIIQQMGVWGFLEVIAEYPEQEDGENDDAYVTRCQTHLEKSKARILSSMKDGIVVGGRRAGMDEPEHEFEFHSLAKSADGLSEPFNINELLVSQGLKHHPALSGKGSQGAQAFVTVIFTKLISELKNIQGAIKKTLEHAYELEFRLMGYQFKDLEVKFNPSTIQDDLKTQQAIEIKIRNARQKRMDGIITQDQYADELGYDKPASQEPVVPFMPEKTTGDPNLDAEKKKVREKSKDTSDKKVREKNK